MALNTERGFVGRAAQFVRPGEAITVTREVRHPGPGEVTVRNRWVTICGSDLHVVHRPESSGEYPMAPGYPGHEGIGRVLASGSAEFAVGDWVLQLPDRSWSDLFADHQVVSDRFLIRLPEGDRRLTEYLMAQQLGTAVFALKRYINPEAPRRVATVVGLGSAGLHFVQLLRNAGFPHVVASDVIAERVQMARELGVDSVVREPVESVVDVTMAISGGAGADLVIDASNTDEGRSQAMRCVGQDGTIGLFGLPTSPLTSVPLTEVFSRNVTIKSAIAAQHEAGLISFHEALRLIRERRVDVSRLVTHTIPLEQLSAGIDLAHRGDDGVVKVAVDLELS